MWMCPKKKLTNAMNCKAVNRSCSRNKHFFVKHLLSVAPFQLIPSSHPEWPTPQSNYLVAWFPVKLSIDRFESTKQNPQQNPTKENRLFLRINTNASVSCSGFFFHEAKQDLPLANNAAVPSVLGGTLVEVLVCVLRAPSNDVKQMLPESVQFEFRTWGAM